MKTLSQLRKARTGLAGQRWLIYGPPKIGKSTFASEAPGTPLFLDCEDGLGFLDVYQVNCDSWAKITAAIDTIARGGHDHKTIVIDTVDRFVSLATEHVQSVLGVEHIGDAGFGKGYGRLREIVDASLYKLTGDGRLVILLSHDRVETAEGKPDKVKPSVSRTQQILGFCDVIGRVELDDAGERRLRFRGSPSVVAGTRGKGGQPLLPPTMPLQWSAIHNHLTKGNMPQATTQTEKEESK